MDRLLEIGDVFKLEKGRSVKTNIKEKFIFGNRCCSEKEVLETIYVGLKYNIESPSMDTKKNLAQCMTRLFSSELGFTYNEEEALDYIETLLRRVDFNESIYDSNILIGEYVVIGVERKDHYVRAKKLNNGNFDENGTEIYFYQNESFGAQIMPNDLELIKKMKMYFI